MHIAYCILAISNPYRKSDLEDTTQKKKKNVGNAKLHVTQGIVGYSGRVNWCLGSSKIQQFTAQGKKKSLARMRPSVILCTILCSTLCTINSGTLQQQRGQQNQAAGSVYWQKLNVPSHPPACTMCSSTTSVVLQQKQHVQHATHGPTDPPTAYYSSAASSTYSSST